MLCPRCDAATEAEAARSAAALRRPAPSRTPWERRSARRWDDREVCRGQRMALQRPGGRRAVEHDEVVALPHGYQRVPERRRHRAPREAWLAQLRELRSAGDDVETCPDVASDERRRLVGEEPPQGTAVVAVLPVTQIAREVALGSRSMASVRQPPAAARPATLATIEVFPTPPLELTTARQLRCTELSRPMRPTGARSSLSWATSCVDRLSSLPMALIWSFCATRALRGCSV